VTAHRRPKADVVEIPKKCLLASGRVFDQPRDIRQPSVGIPRLVAGRPAGAGDSVSRVTVLRWSVQPFSPLSACIGVKDDFRA
jgi:hypothetical protein